MPTTFLIQFYSLVTLSAFSAVILLAAIVSMVLLLFGFCRSKINGYHNKMSAMAEQIEAMQKHLDYASREEIKARADAKRAAAARDKLLTSLSHEIRTPMNGILGMTILLEETNLDPEQRDYVNTIINSGRILLHKVDEAMADEMVEQSKIDHSANPAQLKNTDLRNCVEEVIEAFAVKASKESTELLYQADEEVPMQVLTDIKRLKQVLTNLIEKMMEKEKEQVHIGVHILKHDSTGLVPAIGFTVGKYPKGNSIKVAEMLRKGIGLPGETTEEGQSEKMLGISISKKLVEEMGGNIRLSVDDGFIFSIPLNPVTMHTAKEGYNLKDFEGKEVLIVHRNKTAATILKDQLQQWKLRPMIAIDAGQALMMLQERTFSLVLADMNLPGMNGLQLAAQSKTGFPDLPFILMNPVNDERYKKENISNEIILLKKPIKQHILFDNILGCLRSHKNAATNMSLKQLSPDFARQYPMSILMAEDNLVNQKWAGKILSRLGYECDIAENGHIALEMVDKKNYDLILMDVQMPEMDGLEATRMIRVCLNKQPVIIAMTANVMHGDRMACMQAGMDDYISKPVQLNELVNMLEKWALVIQEKKTA